MSNYQQGKIYTIRCRTDDTMIYVGSTIQPLCERLAGHKVANKKENKKGVLIYRTINNDWKNWYIELHSLCPCSCKEELLRREGEVIREIGTLNSLIAGRTQKEYQDDNKEIILEKHKIYYKNNKEEMLEKNKKNYENNKEIIKEKRNVKITCECGCITTKRNIARHLKSQKHLNFINIVPV